MRKCPALLLLPHHSIDTTSTMRNRFFAPRLLPLSLRRVAHTGYRCSSSVAPRRIRQTDVPVDEHGIPLQAPYSIRDFLASLPTPNLSDEQFIHLHTLSALHPPPRDSPDFLSKKASLEQMIRLVEGVRAAAGAAAAEPHEEEATGGEIPDGRIWPEGQGIKLDWDAPTRTRAQVAQSFNENGRELLELAEKSHLAGYYVTPRKQRGDAE